MSFHTYLLQTFAGTSRFRSDVQSSLLRYQILSIIYFNFILINVIVVIEIALRFLVNESFFSGAGPVLIIFVILSFYLLKKEQRDLAAGAILISIHIINYVSSHHFNLPGATLIGQLIHPVFAFYLTRSNMIRGVNILIGLCLMISHIIKILDIFSVTLTDNQSYQIITLLMNASILFFTISIIFFIHKGIEDKLWKAAQSDFQNFENLTKEVVQAVEAKDTFVSSLSHEIRNPLNALNISIEYLLGSVKDPVQLEVLRNAKMSGDVLANLVNNVLDAAKLKADKMEIACLESNMEDVVKKVLTINSENLKSKEIKSHAFIDNDLPKVLWLDPSRLLQILMNLFSNAYKFTPRKGKIDIHVEWCPPNSDPKVMLEPIKEVSSIRMNPTVPSSSFMLNLPQNTMDDVHSDEDEKSNIFEECTSEEANLRCHTFGDHSLKYNKARNFSRKETRKITSSTYSYWFINKARFPKSDNLLPANQSEDSNIMGYLKIQVSDTGCGIAEENIPKLFGMFAQANRSIGSTYGGTGLGLWLCKQLCQKMGGDITIYSKLKEGTTFVFYIPVNNGPLLRETPTNHLRQKKDRVNALVVDDFSFNQNLHKLLLEREGVKVTTASNGMEAVEDYKSRDDYYDFILMDIHMPEVNGFTAAKMIRDWEKENNKRKVDIYFVSGEYYNEEDILVGFKSKNGGNELSGIRCLRKPLDIEIIQKIVEKYTGNVVRR